MAHKSVRENLDIGNVERRLERRNGKPEYERIEGRIHIALNSLDKQELAFMQERRHMESEKWLRKFSYRGWEVNVDGRYFTVEEKLMCLSGLN